MGSAVSGCIMAHRLHSDRNILRCLVHGGTAFVMASLLNMSMLVNKQEKQNSFSSQIRYCGKFFGSDILPGSNGFCGPNNGPQCTSCTKIHKSDEFQKRLMDK